MESVRDEKRLLVKGPSSFPGRIPERPEIRIPKVFNDDETPDRIVADQPWHWDIDLMEKCRNVSIVRVLYTLQVIMDQDG